MRKNRIYIRITVGFLLGMMIGSSLCPLQAAEADSLQYYLALAEQNNPQVQAAWVTYQATQQKIPQAGALPDPELEMGFYPKPMSILAGKQIANFTLMQMFPWFGSRKAAQEEAGEMARMAYEQYRESRNDLSYAVKSQWYQLCNLQAQKKNTEDNLRLLEQLEQLARNRYSAQPFPAIKTSGQSGMGTTGEAASPSNSGMENMAGMGGSTPPVASPTRPVANPSAMASMGGGAMQSGTANGMADLLRIQMEQAETEERLMEILATRRAAEARFNTLLNRHESLPVAVPDTLVQRIWLPADSAMTTAQIERHPMLAMARAEGESYLAKGRMEKRMSLPMLGIGIQYMLIGKGEAMAMNPMENMNGKDMFMPMVKVSLPLYRRKYNAQQRESRFNYQASLLKQADTRNQLAASYSGLLQQLSTATRKVALYKQQEALSRTTYQLMVRAFSAGSATLTDVIQVERQLLDYALKRCEAIAGYNTVIAGIEQLLTIHPND